MASRVISSLATLAIVAAMAAPALAQSSGGSTGTGSAPATGSGGSTPSATPAPSATQPSSTTPPRHGLRRDGEGEARRGNGSVGDHRAGNRRQHAVLRGGSTAGTSKSGTSMTGGAGSEQVKSVQKALQDKGMDPGPVDGIMGPKTMAALKAFQKDQKLTEAESWTIRRVKS